jgi:cobyrinic acid a,c-diamide synthase
MPLLEQSKRRKIRKGSNASGKHTFGHCHGIMYLKCTEDTLAKYK